MNQIAGCSYIQREREVRLDIFARQKLELKTSAKRLCTTQRRLDQELHLHHRILSHSLSVGPSGNSHHIGRPRRGARSTSPFSSSYISASSSAFGSLGILGCTKTQRSPRFVVATTRPAGPHPLLGSVKSTISSVSGSMTSPSSFR